MAPFYLVIASSLEPLVTFFFEFSVFIALIATSSLYHLLDLEIGGTTGMGGTKRT